MREEGRKTKQFNYMCVFRCVDPADYRRMTCIVVGVRECTGISSKESSRRFSRPDNLLYGFYNYVELVQES